MALGEMADQLLLASTRVVPRRLMQTGYAFQHPTLEDALQHCLISACNERSSGQWTYWLDWERPFWIEPPR